MSHADDRTEETQGQVTAFLRALARRAQAEPALASAIAACLKESGLLASDAGVKAPSEARSRRGRIASAAEKASRDEEILDPFALWRAQGEDALRQALGKQSLANLRAIVRTHRLDPARVSSRWTASERLAALIFEQVRARMYHGRAFEHV
jgi:hypothetical protein